MWQRTVVAHLRFREAEGDGPAGGDAASWSEPIPEHPGTGDPPGPARLGRNPFHVPYPFAPTAWLHHVSILPHTPETGIPSPPDLGFGSRG